MPAALVEELADRRRQLAGDASCELLDWFAKAGELAPAGAVVIGRREIDDCALPVLGLSIEAAGTLFFWTGVLTAFSYLVAVRISQRIGLVRSMVYTHLPSSLCLLAIP